MLHHRWQYGLDIVNHHIITPIKQRPSPGSGKKTLTGPRRKTGMPLTTELREIQDVVD